MTKASGISEFDSAWLDTRYPFDLEARNREVESFIRKSFPEGKNLRVLDLGAGNGANLRYFSSRWESLRHWTLLDHNPELMKVCKSWVNAQDDLDLELNCREGSLSSFDEVVSSADFDLVMANALFDLTTQDEFELVSATLKEYELPLLFTLNYSGMKFYPEDSFDQEVEVSYAKHMRQSGGKVEFMGERAGPAMAEMLLQQGATVVKGESYWHISPGDRQMLNYKIGFIENALSDLYPEGPNAEKGKEWLEKRKNQLRQGNLTIKVSHWDLAARW